MLLHIFNRTVRCRFFLVFQPVYPFQLEYLRDHMATHSAEKRLECRVCHKKFQTMRVMKKHEKTHKVSIFFSRAVQAERLIWSLWCLYVCTYVCMYGCMYVRQLSNRKINHILTYTKEFFLTADLPWPKLTPPPPGQNRTKSATY